MWDEGIRCYRGQFDPNKRPKAQTFKEMYEAQLELPEGWGSHGVLEKIISVGRYGYVMELSNVMQVSPFSFGILNP